MNKHDATQLARRLARDEDVSLESVWQANEDDVLRGQLNPYEPDVELGQWVATFRGWECGSVPQSIILGD